MLNAERLNKTWRLAEPSPERTQQQWFANKRLAQFEYAAGETVVASHPAWITFDSGSVCNLRCVQCLRENPRIKFEEQKASIELADYVAASSQYLERLSLHGLGEPLLSEVFWKLIEDERTQTIPIIDVNSNGTLLSDKNIDRLLASNLKILRISLDGATPETYKRIRGGNLPKVTEGIRRLANRRKELGVSSLRICLQMTLMLENIGELPMMVDLGHDLGTDALWAHHMDLRSDGVHDEWQLTHDGWTFDYKEQHLSNHPVLSNKMVRTAKARADKIGYSFHVHSELWMPE